MFHSNAAVHLYIIIVCRTLAANSLRQRGDIAFNEIQNDSRDNGSGRNGKEKAIDNKVSESAHPRFGSVVSPFFFLCHTPRPGEPIDVGIGDVRVSVNATGEKKLNAGYEAQMLYELTVSSNVQMDGFLLTGVHAVTKELTHSGHLHIPPRAASQNSAGLVCSILHSHISKRPLSKISLMWKAPPAGTGCVVFLATGSLQDQILFKDLTVMEVCEKDKKLDSLQLPRSYLLTKNKAGFVFKDDFEDMQMDQTIWDEVHRGNLTHNPSGQRGMAVILQGSTSFLQTVPLDFSKAQHIQYTIAPGGCHSPSKVKLLLGSVKPLQKSIKTKELIYPKAYHGISEHDRDTVEKSDVVSEIERTTPSGETSPDFDKEENLTKYIIDDSLVEVISLPSGLSFGQMEGSGSGAYSDPETDNTEHRVKSEFISRLSGLSFGQMEGSGSGDHSDRKTDKTEQMVKSELISPPSEFSFSQMEGSGSDDHSDPVIEDAEELLQSDQPQSRKCFHWSEIKVHSTPILTQEVHTEVIPQLFRREDICIKWETYHTEGLHHEDKKDSECWSIDNVAVVTEESHQGALVDDFDPVDPTNWLFFPGGQIKETCGSDGNSLAFGLEGVLNDNWVSTRHLNLSDISYEEDAVIHHKFTGDNHDGWPVRGVAKNTCFGDAEILTFRSRGRREICSPFVDGRAIGVVRLNVGIDDCSVDDADVSLSAAVELNGQRTAFTDFHLNTKFEDKFFALPSKFQQNGIRICIQQTQSPDEGYAAWTLREMTLLPWRPANPKYFFQAQMNLKCSYTESKVDVETSSDGGKTWWSLHTRCIPGRCEGETSELNSLVADGIDSGWTLVTLPLPFVALTPSTRIRIRQLETGNSVWHPKWAIDYIYIGKCPQGCNGHGLCHSSGKCKCEYGYTGDACDVSERPNPLYLSEPFIGTIGTSANILEVSGAEPSYQCGVVGTGQAAVFKGEDLRFITTVDVNTTDAHLLQFHFRAGTVSDVGKCPGPDEENESIYVHYSCSGGATWHLLQTLHSKMYREPSHISIVLPPGARDSSCRFQIWQQEHSGSGRDMWAIDDLTVTSQQFNTIELSFDNHEEANSSLRFHLGLTGNSCGRNETMVFSGSKNNGLFRFLETKSIGIGPSYMMQFDLAIGCEGGTSYTDDLNSTIVLEYSLNHGLTWQLVQRPCTPATPGCQSHFTRGTVYHVSEFNKWKRVTLRLPKHTWSPTTRLRLRQLETSDVGLPWAVDNLFIGHQCAGLCSGHGYCATRGCRCDKDFHGHMCLPLHKLHTEIDADFDEEEDVIDDYDFHIIGGTLTAGAEGCGTVVSGNGLYFGAPGVRHFETDDLYAINLHSIAFHLVVGGDRGLFKSCLSAVDKYKGNRDDAVSYGSVALEYSTDGGISWELLKELIPSEYRKPKQFHMVFDDKVIEEVNSNSGVIRFRIWQPNHDSEDQWSIDNLIVKPAVPIYSLQADFSEDSALESPWLSVTKHSQKRYCESDDVAQVMDSTDPVRMAITNVLTLNENDVISFQISVGCSDEENGSPVRLEYSRDGGNSWKLLQNGCSPGSVDCKQPKEPSMYWPGHHGQWHRVLIPVDHRLAHGDVQLRWMQPNPDETRSGEFALKDLYIGPPCQFSCHGHGLCTAAEICKCEDGYSGKFCGTTEYDHSGWLRDGFENERISSDFWENADGAIVSSGCNSDHTGNVMFFSGDKHRFITTRELDTRHVRYLVFHLLIGADSKESRCAKGVAPRDNVMLEYSADNGLSWHLLQDFAPAPTRQKNKPYFIPLPPNAQSKQTRFRWWQTPPHMIGKNAGQQAEWQLDNVMVMANETLPLNFEETFSYGLSHKWFMMNGGSADKGCERNDASLLFSGHKSPRYAETFDFASSEATVVQFDIMPSCENRKIPTNIYVEYSTNNGKTWNLLKDDCLPSGHQCETYDLSSIFSSNDVKNWTRVTFPIPKSIAGERTRLRFMQKVDKGDVIDPASSWAIDNIFIGDSCPWMCSGHGYCHQNKCMCDEGFFGEFCVPEKVLPCEILDTFRDEYVNKSLWSDVLGADISTRCGSVVSNLSLVFFKEGHRYASTVDLDMTGGQFVQFTLLMGCQRNLKKNPRGSDNVREDSEDEEDSRTSILVQFSTNGGIVWDGLKMIHFSSQNDPVLISICLSDFPKARTNATRFRFWQPSRHISLKNVWAIDNVFIGGMPVHPNVLYDDFNGNLPVSDAWIDWPSGDIRPMCDSYDPRSALVIGSGEGEHALYTRDLTVDEKSVIQFDIRVGCTNTTTESHNVTLEYSTDFGLTWTPIRLVRLLYTESSDYLHELQTPTVYYASSGRGWERVIVPLNDLPVCRNVRFRWWQGFYHPKEASVVWALDNIYIGPSCPHQCSGHGYCINGDSCDCDENYEEDYCRLLTQNDEEILQDFEDDSLSSDFIRWSGAEISSQCEVLSGKGLLFWQQGERMLVTKDIDLTHGSVVQFYLRMRCSELARLRDVNAHQEPILLQYSKDGGIVWKLISELSDQSNSMEELPSTKHYTFSLPVAAKTNSTRLRWWQPSTDGVFHDQWAIDQIYVGSAASGLKYFFDNGTGSEWLLRPGSKAEKACDLNSTGLHFSGNSGVRFAETPDIFTATKTFLHFEIAIGCKEISHCYDVHVEYSVDHGHTWDLIREECLPSDPDCPEWWSSSVLTSDLFSSVTQVNLILPKRARSKLARFRLSQKFPWDPHHPWLVSRVYVGDGCPNLCSGRGFCEAGTCDCHIGWTGEECQNRKTELPHFIADNFNENPSTSFWDKIVGAKISEICGPIASGPALHFYGAQTTLTGRVAATIRTCEAKYLLIHQPRGLVSKQTLVLHMLGKASIFSLQYPWTYGCSRLLQTVDIDLREALFIQFDLRTGCLDPVLNETAGGDNSILVQTSCNGGISWRTLRRLSLVYAVPKYVWIELPQYARCLGGRVRWWQPGRGPRTNKLDWALDSIVVGGKTSPPSSLSIASPNDLKFPLWIRGYNFKYGFYCNFHESVLVLESTPSEPAIIETTDIQITVNHSLHFRIALGCGALWDNSIEPVSMQYSRDHGRSWELVRDMCLPFNSSFCKDLHDDSVFYAPQEWQYYVFPLNNIGPFKYVRFRWIQNATADVMGSHKWAVADIYIGLSCPYHCLGRGSCQDQVCYCEKGYAGNYCQIIITPNIPYIKDTFHGPGFDDHWNHVQGALLGPGCAGDLEEPPAVTFQGPHTRAIKSRPVDTRSARFVLFTAHIGSSFGRGLCREPDQRIHNVFLQYSADGGITWNLLRELDHKLYRKPHEDYVVLPRDAMTPATVFRFWQPRLVPSSPAWSLDNVFIGGSEIGAVNLLDSFDGEPTISEWLFAPHSKREENYCEKGDNGSLVWQADHPGHRAITTQELIIYDGHVLQFKISVGCRQQTAECYNGPQVHLEFTKEGGATGWDLVRDSCLPETSPDPACFPYTFHGPSIFSPDVYATWTRVTIPLPEKTWSSTTQFRWIQDAGRNGKQVERILPWALDDVYIGVPCEEHCRGHGDCFNGKCVCDPGYEGPSCEPQSSLKEPLPTSLIDGFEGSLKTNWQTITGGSIGMGCNSLAPYGHGKHLYFSGCGTRQAITVDLDTRRASKVMFVIRIGSHDNTRSCHVDLTDPKRAGNKGVIFQYSSDNGITWSTLDVHDPLDFRKARRVAYSLPEEARQNGVQLRWWQPDHNGLGTDQWALDNVEIVLAQRKHTNKYQARVYYHQEDL